MNMKKLKSQAKQSTWNIGQMSSTEVSMVYVVRNRRISSRPITGTYIPSERLAYLQHGTHKCNSEVNDILLHGIMLFNNFSMAAAKCLNYFCSGWICAGLGMPNSSAARHA